MTISLQALDTMEYKVVGGAGLNFNVKAGQEITVELENVGKMKIELMGHNFVLLKKGESATEFGNEVIKKGGNLENGFIPAELADKVLVHTKLLGPGETDSVTFKLDEPGVYSYLCTFTGHAAKMNGRFNAK